MSAPRPYPYEPVDGTSYVGPHDSGPDHYWARYRDGHVELTPRALRQCEVGAVGGTPTLCRWFANMPSDENCPVCHDRRRSSAR